MSLRQRSTFYAIVALVLVWMVALGGYLAFKNSKMTADKLRAYLEQTELSRLSGEARAKALRDLAAKINALSAEERQNARRGHLWDRWFAEMTEAEKGAFLDATLPSGFKQMMAGFEKMPQEKRQKAIDTAIKRLREARESPSQGTNQFSARRGTNAPVLSEELQHKVAVIGLKSVYSDSSAETKAQLAPLLEELQKSMESGRLFRGGGR